MDPKANTTDPAMLINTPAVDDVVAATIAYSQLDIFSSNRRELHAFFRCLKADPDCKGLLEEIVFSEGADLFPFSRTLENALVRLQLGGLIYARNPEHDKYSMTPEALAKTLEKAKKRFSESQVESLVKAGRLFQTTFSSPNRPFVV